MSRLAFPEASSSPLQIRPPRGGGEPVRVTVSSPRPRTIPTRVGRQGRTAPLPARHTRRVIHRTIHLPRDVREQFERMVAHGTGSVTAPVASARTHCQPQHRLLHASVFQMLDTQRLDADYPAASRASGTGCLNRLPSAPPRIDADVHEEHGLRREKPQPLRQSAGG
ncbi:MAG: hypothetical protein FD140_4488 [Limisphaerales bacterium]|nr:MAG: hypothetical protein FD140_4488 [Limisphaerales bacterium]